MIVVSVVFGLVALVGIGICVAHFVLAAGWKDAVQTQGVVVDHELRPRLQGGDRTKRDMYRPVIEFTDKSGEPRRFTSKTASTDPPAIGEIIDIEYKPGKPTAVREATALSRNLLLLVGFGLAFVFGSFSAGAAVAASRIANRPPSSDDDAPGPQT
ncbi:hypothetical protein GCM10027418_27960 [Mariniluteicoccus endophyticus]